jgi:hypothetical protein
VARPEQLLATIAPSAGPVVRLHWTAVLACGCT